MTNKNVCSEQSENVKKIRKKVGITQAELSNVLGVSIRAVQSYEQGWRDVPTHIMVQMLVIAAAYYTKGDRKKCWEIMRCHAQTLENCACRKTDGTLCWLISGRQSAPCKDGEDGIAACLKCPVVRRLLA